MHLHNSHRPYRLMQDDEMLSLPVEPLTDDGYLFLWVTARAIDLGYKCIEKWGYTPVQELVWVKVNQLQQLITSGITGHWINHGKEHCLIAKKGNPQFGGVDRALDCDVLVSELRETSRKPDEIYGLLERLAPGARKIELFGRQHNVQKNWTTLGNQLDGIKLVEQDVIDRYTARYCDQDAQTIQRDLLVSCATVPTPPLLPSFCSAPTPLCLPRRHLLPPPSPYHRSIDATRASRDEPCGGMDMLNESNPILD